MRSAVKTTGKVGSYMKIQDFCDMDKFEQIMKNLALMRINISRL